MRSSRVYSPITESTDAAERSGQRWRARVGGRLAIGFVVVFLAIQVLFPLVQMLWAPRPARFGWQMYSVVSAPPQFRIVLADRTEQTVDIATYVISMRGDVPLAQYLPPHLCTQFPKAAAVRYDLHDGTASGTYRCT